MKQVLVYKRIIIGLFLSFLVFQASSFSQPHTPKEGDADYPILPQGADWALERHGQKLKAIRKNSYDLVLIGNSISQIIGEIGGKYEPLKSVWEKYFAPYNAINLGYSGFRTENILWNLHNGELDFQKSPKLFVLLIGTNNADSRHFPVAHSPRQIYAGTKAIVDLIRQRHPSSKILVLRIFPKGLDSQKNEATSPPVFSFSTSDIKKAKRAGLLTRKLADGRNVFWMDVNHLFIRRDGKINVELMPDLLHPNLAGTEAWVSAIETMMLKLMNMEQK
jgi:lysophospholipase L1-like esterase